MCVSDILGKKSREKVYRLEKNRGWSVGVFRPLSIPASGTSSNTNVSAANTEKCLFECTVNEESVRTPCKNRFTSTNTTLPVISVEKLKRRALFVKGFAYTSTFSTCNLFHTARCARSRWGQVMFLNWETTTWGITMARLNIEKFPTSHTKCKDYLRHLILERRMQRRFLQSNGSFVWSVWSFGLSSFVFFFIYSLLKYIYLRKYHARF